MKPPVMLFDTVNKFAGAIAYWFPSETAHDFSHVLTGQADLSGDEQSLDESEYMYDDEENDGENDAEYDAENDGESDDDVDGGDAMSATRYGSNTPRSLTTSQRTPDPSTGLPTTWNGDATDTTVRPGSANSRSSQGLNDDTLVPFTGSQVASTICVPPPTQEYVASQVQRFEDLVQRNSREKVSGWWPSFVREKRTNSENDASANELAALTEKLSPSAKRQLLKMLVADFASEMTVDGEAGGEEFVDASDQDLADDSAILVERLDRFVHLGMRLAILLGQAAIPLAQSLYRNYQRDKLYIFNRRNTLRMVDSALGLMLILEESLRAGNYELAMEVVWDRFLWLVNLAKESILALMTSDFPADSGTITGIGRATIEYAIRAYNSTFSTPAGYEQRTDKERTKKSKSNKEQKRRQILERQKHHMQRGGGPTKEYGPDFWRAVERAIQQSRFDS